MTYQDFTHRLKHFNSNIVIRMIDQAVDMFDIFLNEFIVQTQFTLGKSLSVDFERWSDFIIAFALGNVIVEEMVNNNGRTGFFND